MPNLTEQFANEFTSRAIDLNRLASGTQRRALATLYDLQDDLRDKIRRWNLEGVPSQARKVVRAEGLISQAQGSIQKHYNMMNRGLGTELRELASLESRQTVRMMNTVIGADLMSATLTAGDLRVLVDDATIRGGKAATWWAKQSRDAQNRFANEMRLGVAAGETNDQLIRRMQGTPTGRMTVGTGAKARSVRRYSGGVIGQSTREVEALVRTSVQTVSNKVLQDVYDQNRDIISAMQTLATLDGRTTPICIARSGGIWDMKTGEPTPDSTVQEGFPGAPPWHWRCRTILIPVTKSWEQLSEELTGKKRRILNSVPDSTRASMDGQVAGKLTWPEWAKTKPTSFMQQKFGQRTFELFEDGRISFTQLIDQSGRPLSVAQLERLGEIQMLSRAVKGAAPVAVDPTGPTIPVQRHKNPNHLTPLPKDGQTTSQRADRLVDKLPEGQRGLLALDPRKYAPIQRPPASVSSSTRRAASRAMDKIQNVLENVGSSVGGTIGGEFSKIVTKLLPTAAQVAVSPKRLLRVALGTGLLTVGTVSQLLSTYANLTYAALRVTVSGSFKGLGLVSKIPGMGGRVLHFRKVFASTGTAVQESGEIQSWIQRTLQKAIKGPVEKVIPLVRAKALEAGRKFGVDFKKNPYQTVISNGLLLTPAPFSADIGFSIRSGFELWNKFDPLSSQGSIRAAFMRAWKERPKIIPKDIAYAAGKAKRWMSKSLGLDIPTPIIGGSFLERGQRVVNGWTSSANDKWRKIMNADEVLPSMVTTTARTPAVRAAHSRAWSQVAEMIDGSANHIGKTLGGETASGLVRLPRAGLRLFDPRALLRLGMGAGIATQGSVRGYLSYVSSFAGQIVKGGATVVPLAFRVSIRVGGFVIRGVPRTVYRTLSFQVRVVVPSAASLYVKAAGTSAASQARAYADAFSNATKPVFEDIVPGRVNRAIKSIIDKAGGAKIDLGQDPLQSFVSISVVATPAPLSMDVGISMQSAFTRWDNYNPLQLQSLVGEGAGVAARRTLERVAREADKAATASARALARQ